MNMADLLERLTDHFDQGFESRRDDYHVELAGFGSNTVNCNLAGHRYRAASTNDGRAADGRSTGRAASRRSILMEVWRYVRRRRRAVNQTLSSASFDFRDNRERESDVKQLAPRLLY